MNRTSVTRPARSHQSPPWPFIWVLLAVAALAAASQLQLPELWQGMLLAVPVVLASAGRGWLTGALIAPVGLALVWGGRTPLLTQPEEAAGLLAIVVLALVGGQSLHLRWRTATERAQRNERRARLLSEAALGLQQIGGPRELYAALPQMLADILEFTHAEVFVPLDDALELVASHGWDAPPGMRVPLSSVTGHAYRLSRWQYVPDSRHNPAFMPAPGAPATRSELALPLHIDGAVAAVLNIEHVEVDAFSSDDRKTLRAFAHLAEETLERLHSLQALEGRMTEQSLVARLNHQLLVAESAEEAAATLLVELRGALRLDLAAVLALRGGAFAPIAVDAALDDDDRARFEENLSGERGWLHRAWQRRRSIFIEDYQTTPDGDPLRLRLGLRGVAFVPIANARGEVQALLELGSFAAPRRWPLDERRLLEIAANALGVALERASLNAQLVEMLEVIRQLAQADDPRVLFERAAEAAVRLIPGAESSSLLVRQEDGFRFVASHGFPLDELRRIEDIGEAAQLTWYRNGEDAFYAGTPRLLTGSQVARTSLATEAKSHIRDILERAGRVRDIQANICVPIVYGREVIGLLNIDNLTYADAFGQGALKLAEAFAQQVAVIIRQTLYRDALERTVVTDALTGLGNREGFNRRLKRELVRTRRYGQPLSLVMMDLDGFKEINDNLGHQMGDRALVAVAEAMRGERREVDSLYRWGGDEFALILPQTHRDEAQTAAERYARAIRRLRVGDFGMNVSVGIASWPEDGSDSETLLRKADDLMYQHKHG